MIDKKLEEAAQRHAWDRGFLAGAKWYRENLDYLELMIAMKNKCFDNIEGADGDSFMRWNELYCHYCAIVEDIEKERDGKAG